ncbi:N-acetyl-glucosamine-6-phosphate deacetylase [Crocosphaera subtropica ATCC 51142]|uniref:N-acetyl-glucosamine-6-phosphate deacetylase n=1 Tax=Crocosphaera subtropica (strain ATCC 51142 / BH68) TaxID=43989 RepID=B1WW57_CROS5|nr:N-acetylglucosamine-6-phosphate deacetylase [Crocosphaera subtropica]ACB53985.1 N-acetyl-glucosamine-6-phosphate deacetylase [Crocosphaera subtropica ATCC 51142]
MLKDITIINAKLHGYQEHQKILINEQGKIEDIQGMGAIDSTKTGDKVYDAKGDWISLGGIDLQINGGLGLPFTDIQEKHLPKLHQICEFLWQEGIDGFLPTLVTTSVDNIQRSLSILERFIKIQTEENVPTAKVLGVHLEGPFLNHEKKGAHPAQYLLTPSVEAIEWLLGNYESIVKIITLAPELDITNEVIPYLSSRGIVASLGHSQANAKEAKKAFEMGASMVTHAFNAMPPLHHRQPGLLGEAIINSNVYCGLIADGNHVCPTMIELLLRGSLYERGVFLVSDALAPIGLGDGVYPWDNRQIEVKQGTARLANGTLAGTTLPLLVGVKNLVEWQLCPIGNGIALATESPRKAIKLPAMSPGQPANLLQWHWDNENNQLNWKRL